MSPRLIDGKETRIHDMITQMHQAADQAIADALQSFQNHDAELAQQVVDNDESINRIQHDIEEECFSVIAMHQPVATDLRDIFSNVHIAIELERIADHAADICRIVLKMSRATKGELAEPICMLGETCREMLAVAMSADSSIDTRQARDIAADDEQVDRAEQDIIDQAITMLCDNEEMNRVITQTIWVAHNIERIGDRITNIAEQIIFHATGDVVDLNR